MFARRHAAEIFGSRIAYMPPRPSATCASAILVLEMLCGLRELIPFRRAILASQGHAFSSSASVARFNGLQCLLGGGADDGARVAEHFLECRHRVDGLGAEES